MSTFKPRIADQSIPALTLVAPGLRGFTLVRDQHGVPVVREGRRAVACAFRCPDGQMYALRVLPNGQSNMADRYRKVCDYLEHHRVPHLVGCRYVSDAVRCDESSAPAPAVLMDWVQGATLDAWVAQQLNQPPHGSQNPAENLAQMAERWHELAKALAAHRVVHGDLEPGNVMVEPAGQLKLIDYDNLCTPALIGHATSHPGVRPYQHPGRSAQTLAFAGLDNFAALIIYTSFRALSADPRLWSTRIRIDSPAPLLFNEEELSSAANQSILRGLSKSPDEQVRDLGHYLQQLSKGDLRDVPSIDEVLLWCNSLESLLANGDFDRAISLVGRLGSAERIDQSTLSQIDLAHRRVACRKALLAAVESGRPDEIERAFDRDLLADYPAAAPVVAQAQRLLELGRNMQLIDAAFAARQWHEFSRLWELHGGQAKGLPGSARYQKVFDQLSLAKQLEKLLNDPESDERVVVHEWQQLFIADEPPIAERLHRAKECRATRRKLYLEIEHLLSVSSHAPTFETDQRIRQLWKQAEELGETRIESWRPHYRLAKIRMKRLRFLNALAKAPSVAGEQHVAACVRYLPPSYHAKLPGRIRLAKQRLDSVRVLEMALLEPISEHGLLVSWKAVVASKGQSLVSNEWRQRVQLAQRRLALVDQLNACRALPADKRDQHVLALWDEAILAGCNETNRVRDLWDETKRRVAMLEQLAAALDAGDTTLVQRQLATPGLHNYSYSVELQSRIDAYREQLAHFRQEQRHALVQAILDHDIGRFRQLFDRELVADLCAQVPAHQRIVSAWIERELLPLGMSGLKAVTRNGLSRLDSDRWRASWIAPADFIANHCLLTVSRDGAKPHAAPADMDLLHSVPMACVADAGASEPVVVDFVVKPDWTGANVLVWGVIELGFQTFYSEPLSLGQLRPPDQ